jgi:predicted nuclease with TOPRIM domain
MSQEVVLSTKAAAVPSTSETIECPLCSGTGELSRAEILDRLGVRDFARVAQLSAEEAFRLLQNRHDREHQNAWSRFESELTKRTAELRERFKDELRLALSEKESLSRRVEDSLREVAQLREQNQALESELSKVARVGKLEEVTFAEEARTWSGIALERVSKNGDFLLAYRDPSGTALEPRLIIDNKDKATVTESDIKKLIRDTKERRSLVGIIVAREESQLRQLDRERRWGQEDGVWVLRTTRAWLPRDLEVLKPMFERMRAEGADFLQRNSALAEEVRRTFVELDEIEKELKKAAKAVETASGLTAKYRVRLQALCDGTQCPKPVRGASDVCQTVSA